MTWQLEPDRVEDWAFLNEVFTPEECAKIIEIGNRELQIATVKGDELIQSIRESQISWLRPSAETDWMFRRVTDAVTDMNKKYFNFDLLGLAEGFQFTRYDAPTGRYGMHMDKSLNGSVRKLSLTIQLSDPDDYEGGDLVIYTDATPQMMKREKGKLVLFASYILHEVRPVTKGTRYSLVAWIAGKPFK